MLASHRWDDFWADFSSVLAVQDKYKKVRSETRSWVSALGLPLTPTISCLYHTHDDPMAVVGIDTISEFGREYGIFRRDQYLMPHDERERDRLDLMHTMIKVLRGQTNKLTNCPTDALARRPVSLADFEDRARVLDLGCGTGIWMLDMAKTFPDAQFVGVDIHNMGPPTLLPNISIRAPWDYETIWAMGERSWDLIHLQMGLGSVGDWLGLYRKIIQHLIPGKGWFEQVEIDFQPRCDDGTLARGRLTEWWELYVKPVYEEAKRPLHYDDHRIQRELQAAGFVDLQRRSYQLPLNGWSQQINERRAGLWWNIALSSGHESTSGLGLEAMSLAALCKYGGGSWTPEQVRRLCDEAIQQASDPNVHVYHMVHVWWGRAPAQ